MILKKKRRKQKMVNKEMLQGFVNDLLPVADISSFYRIAVFGKNGTGKTTFAATCPKPALLLDFNEKGTKSIKNIPDIKVKLMRTEEDIELAIYFLKNINHPFKTVIIDTGTGMQAQVLTQVMGNAAELDSSKSLKMATRQDWGNMSINMKRYINEFKEIGDKMHVIWLIQEKFDDDADMSAGEHAVFPELSPSVCSALCASVDVIAQTLIVNDTQKKDDKMVNVTVYAMRIGPDSKVLTKMRTPKGTEKPQFISDPTFEKIDIISSGKWAEYKKQLAEKQKEEVSTKAISDEDEE